MVVAGQWHTCALGTNGKTYCWGDNWDGQLGSSLPYSTKAVPVETDLKFTSIMAGGFHTCGLTAEGRAYCWGKNDQGQLGDGTTTGRHTPTAVSGTLTFVALTASEFHTCGITKSMDAYCWGGNQLGLLGNGTAGVYPDPHPYPAPVIGGLKFTSISASTQVHTCGLTDDQRIYCWGYNWSGQLGRGYQSKGEPVPAEVAGGMQFNVVGAGGYHTCARALNNSIYCWGGNWDAQLGNVGYPLGTLVLQPALVNLTTEFAYFWPGGQGSCGTAADGSAYCWGLNSYGALGGPSYDSCANGSCSITPVAVSGGLRFKMLSNGGGHRCGLTFSQKVYCWGYGEEGQLGNGMMSNSSTPVEVVPN
jgi:hypothetical protein